MFGAKGKSIKPKAMIKTGNTPRRNSEYGKRKKNAIPKPPNEAHINCLKNIVHGEKPRFSATIEDDDMTITKPKVTSVSTVRKIMKKVVLAGFCATLRDDSKPPRSRTARRR
jgi:hypothetical protein